MLGWRLRSRMGRRLGREFRLRPFLALGLALAAVIACVAFVAVLVTVLLSVLVVVALGLATYEIGRRFVRQAVNKSGRRVPVLHEPEAGREAAIRHYLSAVDEFSRLVALAMAEPVEQVRRGKQWRPLKDDARRLQRLAVSLHDQWQGADGSTWRRLRTAWGAGSREAASPTFELDGCLADLERASIVLCCYLDELERGGAKRLSVAELRWQREELGRQHDRLASNLRGLDLRGASRPAPAS
jgi:hypothetical protein